MVILADFEEKTVFNKVKSVDLISHTLINGIDTETNMKFLLLSSSDEHRVFLTTTPKTNALIFPKTILLDESPKELNITVKSSLLPIKWSGELNILCGGFLTKIPIYLERSEKMH